MRLAVRHRHVGWVFLALASMLMLGRRGFSLFADFLNQRTADPAAECIALLISTLMMLGLTLLLNWRPPPEESAATEEGIRHDAMRRLRRQAVFLALMSLFGCAALSYFAYTASRAAVTERLLKGSLDLAHMLAAAANSAPDNAAAARELDRLWKLANSQYRDNYLCVIGADGRLLMNSRKPEKAGVFVGGTVLPGEGKGPRTVGELVKAGADWAGRNRNPEGERQIAAYAFSAEMNALVAVHLPAASVDGEIRAAALPWALGFGMLFIVMLPLSFALLYYVGTSSQEAAFQALERKAESEERLRILTDNADVGLVLVDAGHRYVFANAAYAKVLGLPLAAIDGKRVADVLPDVYEEHIRPRLDRALAGERVVYELHLPGEGGGRFLAAKYDPIRADGVVVRVAVVVVDVTERKQTEERVRQLNRTYAVLSGINELIVRERDPLKMLNEGCRIAVEVGHFRMAWIGLADEAGEVRSVTAHGGASEDTVEKLHAILNGPAGRCGCTFTDRALKAGAQAICNDIGNDPEAEAWRDDALHRNYQSMTSLPLKVAGKIAGTFNLYATEAGFFGAEEMRLLDELAADIGFALEVSQREAERSSAEAEVRTQLDELLRWQSVMLAREDRVHELKAEVNKLLAGQGQPARYSSQEQA